MSESSVKPQILVAEDDKSNYRLTEILLQSHYDIIHAWDGIEAVDLYNEHHPALVLMDINMPHVDGYDAMKQLKRINPQLPVIAVTAYAMSGDEEKILAAGFDGYLAKPININTFELLVTKFLK